METVRVTIIEKLGPDSYIIPCAYCEGKGREPGDMGADVPNKKGYFYPSRVYSWYVSSCPICDGKGVLRIKTQDIPIKDARCEGTGKDPSCWRQYESHHPSARKCTTCNGIGARSLTGKLEVLK